MATEAAPFFPQRVREKVFEHVKARLEPTDHHISFALSDVYVVSFTFIRGQYKAMVSTTLPDGMYYEVIYNSLKQETYIVSYKQWETVTIPDTVEADLS